MIQGSCSHLLIIIGGIKRIVIVFVEHVFFAYTCIYMSYLICNKFIICVNVMI